jgi:hypothetical protein
MGAAVFDKDIPTRLRFRLPYPLISPETPYEMTGLSQMWYSEPRCLRLVITTAYITELLIG